MRDNIKIPNNPQHDKNHRASTALDDLGLLASASFAFACRPARTRLDRTQQHNNTTTRRPPMHSIVPARAAGQPARGLLSHARPDAVTALPPAERTGVELRTTNYELRYNYNYNYNTKPVLVSSRRAMGIVSYCIRPIRIVLYSTVPRVLLYCTYSRGTGPHAARSPSPSRS